MTPSQIAESLMVLIEADQPTFVHGSPGVGKSDTVRQVADRLFGPHHGYKVDQLGRLHGPDGKPTDERPYLFDIRTVLLDPVDLRGLPHLNGAGRTQWAPPVFLPDHGPALIFLDELTSAPPLVQAACYQLVLDRRLGEYRVPDGCRIVAAGNRQTDRAVVHKMSSALANRFTHLDYETDLNDWVKWATLHDIEPFVIGFLRARPELLFKFNPESHAWPSPRTWEKASKVLKAKPPENIMQGLLAGTVGKGEATEFYALFKLYKELPTVEEIIKDPKKTPVPKKTDPSLSYAVTSALARAANSKNLDKIIIYVNRMEPEFSVLTIRDATVRDQELCSTVPFQDWTKTHGEYIGGAA